MFLVRWMGLEIQWKPSWKHGRAWKPCFQLGFHWISKLIHLTRIRCSGWVRAAWIINEFEKFIPTPATNETKIKQQLLRDYEQFARRMILLYIYHVQNIEPHPFHVKSTWISQLQHSVALESYLENVTTQLAEIKIIRPKNNLSRNEVKTLKELKNNPATNLKKANKGTTIVIMNEADKIYEAKVQLDNRKHYGENHTGKS